MAITAGNSAKQANGSSVGSFNFTFDSGSGTDSFLIIQLWWQNSRTITACTYNGVALTNIATLDTGGGERHAAYYLVNPSSGSNTLAVSFSANTQYECSAFSMFGVDQSSPIGATRTELGLETGTTYAESLTTTTDDSWIIWSTRDYAARTITAGADTTLLERHTVAYLMIHARSTSGAPAGSRTLNLNASASANWFSDILTEVKPAGGGGGPSPTGFFQFF
jgi:hypothetical protein